MPDMRKNVKLAVTGALSAVIILMGIPGIHLGYIQISPAVSLTLMHVPVILAAIFAEGTGAVVLPFFSSQSGVYKRAASR